MIVLLRFMLKNEVQECLGKFPLNVVAEKVMNIHEEGVTRLGSECPLSHYGPNFELYAVPVLRDEAPK